MNYDNNDLKEILMSARITGMCMLLAKALSANIIDTGTFRALKEIMDEFEKKLVK
tara:strand:+ start:102 stop:266 length:165 start_codon:yes stop_codon:yes gene_type:complete